MLKRVERRHNPFVHIKKPVHTAFGHCYTSVQNNMTLALITRLNGPDRAAAAACAMEYIWNEDASNDQFA